MSMIGMISGTSFDAVEALLADLELDGDRARVRPRRTPLRALPAAVRHAIAAILPPAPTTIEQVCRLDVAIGQFFADVAKDLADGTGGVDAICSHGQTVYHWVEGGTARGTLQLGEPAWIAERTGARGDQRRAQPRHRLRRPRGALGQPARRLAARGHTRPRSCGSLNLGGIANVTVLGPGREPLAFDIGPANALIDAAVEMLTDGAQSFDAGGAWAARGRPDPALVERLLDDPYFSLPPPKSTGKEYFNLGYVTRRLDGREMAAEDLLASLTVATAEMVAAAVRPFQPGELIVAGGGTRNVTFMGELQARLPGREDAADGRPRRARGGQGGARVRHHRLPHPPRPARHRPLVHGRSPVQRARRHNPGARPVGRPAGAVTRGPGRRRPAPARLVVRTPLPSP